MATMVVEVYDELIDAGASDEKSRAAAKAIADLDIRFNRVEGDLNLLKWMVGANIGLTLAIVTRTFF